MPSPGAPPENLDLWFDARVWSTKSLAKEYDIHRLKVYVTIATIGSLNNNRSYSIWIQVESSWGSNTTTAVIPTNFGAFTSANQRRTQHNTDPKGSRIMIFNHTNIYTGVMYIWYHHDIIWYWVYVHASMYIYDYICVCTLYTHIVYIYIEYIYIYIYRYTYTHNIRIYT